MQLSSYSSIYNLGHKAIADLTKGRCLVEEKVDGSQISFGLLDGELHIRSKSAVIQTQYPPKMFALAVEVIQGLELNPSYIYRGEYLAKPKQNTLSYARIPQNHIVIFDISDGIESYLPFGAKAGEAIRLGFECVPLLFSGEVTLDILKKLLETESFLGGPLVEGVVIKPFNYDLYGLDHKVLMGKYVSEAFKETHKREWKAGTGKDIVQMLAAEFAVPVRWEKMVHVLRDSGELTDSPKDIGALLKLTAQDLEKEEVDYIKERLYAHFRKDLFRASLHGLPAWYKERLMKSQFEDAAHEPEAEAPPM